MILNIRHCGIVTNDLDRSQAFYEKILGFKIVKVMEESGNFIDTILGINNTKVTTVKMASENGEIIELLYYHSPEAQSVDRKRLNETGLTHIALTVQEIDEKYKQLRMLGVKFISPPQVSPDGFAKVAFCQDPEGNYIELVEEL